MSEARSSVVSQWFGESSEYSTFEDYIRPVDAKVAEWFALGMESIQEGIMPTDVSIGQLPKRMVVDSRILELSYQAIHNDADELENLLIIISDITSALEHQAVEQEQKQLMEIFGHIMRDKLGFLEFLTESDRLINAVIENRYEDLPHLKRLIHTIKGNAGLFGITSVATLCNQLEDEIAIKGKAIEKEKLMELQEEWSTVRGKLDHLLGKRINKNIEINKPDYEAVLESLLNREDLDKIGEMVKSWKLETAQHRLDLIKLQTKSLAQRMDKKDIDVRIQHHNIRFESKHWASFWASFIHILRNAIGHGIEPKEDRSKLNKTARGLIQIATFVEDGEFVISVEDDGRGIDWDTIRRKAVETGLPHKNEAELVNVLFQDGITTKEVITNFSGRGVGLSAMKEECEKRGGRISLESQAGKGTKILFRFPMTKHVYYSGNGLLPKVA